MRRLLISCLLLITLVSASLAQTDPGVFALIGFFDQELVYVNQNTGNSHSLGELSSTAYALRIHEDRLYVINGDDWFTGEGASLWVANLDHLTDVVHNGGNVDWTIVPLTDGTNPYDLAGFGQYIYITLQNGNGIIKLDADNDFVEVESAYDLNMPQGVAISGAIVCVAESGLGAGQQVTFFDLELNSPYSISVGLNPQMITTDQAGNFHVICTGDYGDITGEAWRIDPVMNEPGTSSIALGGTPGVLTAMNDGTGNEKIVCGDEYAANPPYLYAYDAEHMTLDETVPVNRSGGWSLAAGNDGIFIGSAISNTIQYNAFDWSGYQQLHSFDGAVAALAYYEMPATSIADNRTYSPSGFTLSPVWPNPFNASATVELSLDQPLVASIMLYDVLGRQVRTLYHGQLSPGSHQLHLDAQNLASGSYFITVNANGLSKIQTVTLVR